MAGGANSLLRWDTTELPSEAVIESASLRAVAVTMHGNGEASSLTADWYDWGDTCDPSDYSAQPLTGALSVNGNCGEGCFLALMPQARDVELKLDGAAAHIARGPAAAPEGTATPALTSLRLNVDLGQTLSPETATEIFAYADFTGPWAPPRLVVHWCEATPTPTPAPTPTPTPEE